MDLPLSTLLTGFFTVLVWVPFPLSFVACSTSLKAILLICRFHGRNFGYRAIDDHCCRISSSRFAAMAESNCINGNTGI